MLLAISEAIISILQDASKRFLIQRKMNFFTLMLVAALQTKSESNLNLTGDQLIS